MTGDGSADETGREVTHTDGESGEQEVTITVIDSDDRSATTETTVTVAERSEDECPEIDVTGDGDPATDTTGDGLLNDVNGDGEFSVTDVQIFFENLNSAPVRENPEWFDFSGTGGDVDIADVQALFERL